MARHAPLLADADIVVGHIWRAGFPPAPRLRLLQSVAAGLDLLDLDAVPKGVTVCNVFGHEPAIPEYVIMTNLAGARWPAISTASPAANRSKTSCFQT